MYTTSTLLRRAVWAMAVPCVLLAGPVRAQGNGPLQTQKCNEPPPTFDGATAFESLEGDLATLVTGKALKPGTTVPTNGTNSRESPELGGPKLLSTSQSFEFKDPKGLISGKYTEMIVQGTDKKCKCHLRIQIREGCVSRVMISKYVHPLKLVADYRDDLGGRIPSKVASRSTDGTQISFDLAAPVCAGQDSRWLLLNTSVDEVAPLSVLQFVSPEGQLSQPLPVHVPLIK
jgi:hypothetical protein